MAYRGIIGTTDGKDRRETDSDSFDDSMGAPVTEHTTSTMTPSRPNRVSATTTDLEDPKQPKTIMKKQATILGTKPKLRLNCKCEHTLSLSYSPTLPLSLTLSRLRGI